MKKMLAAILFSTIILWHFAVSADQPSVIIVILEKNKGELQTVGMAKSAIAGELAKAGWRVIDTNSYPVTLSGEDLNEYYLQKNGGKGTSSKKNSISATVNADGGFAFTSTKDESIINRAGLRKLQWRIDLDMVVSQASSAGAQYVIYGEVTAKSENQGGPGELTSEGFTSCMAIANLRLIETGSRNVVSTFTEQVPGIQANKESAGIEAIKNAGKKAGGFFAKEMSPKEPAKN